MFCLFFVVAFCVLGYSNTWLELRVANLEPSGPRGINLGVAGHAEGFEGTEIPALAFLACQFHMSWPTVGNQLGACCPLFMSFLLRHSLQASGGNGVRVACETL